jgi:hypothetical protein
MTSMTRPWPVKDGQTNAPATFQIGRDFAGFSWWDGAVSFSARPEIALPIEAAGGTVSSDDLASDLRVDVAGVAQVCAPSPSPPPTVAE